MTSAFSWQNSIGLCPASFRIPRPNSPVTPGISSEKAMASHSSTLAWKIPWTEEPGRLQSMGSQRIAHDWSGSRQIWPWSMEWSRAKTNRVLPREHTGHSKHPLPTTQEKTLHMDITRWSTLKSDWLYSLQPKIEKLYTVSKNKTRSWLWLRPWTPYCQIQT